MIAGLNLCLEDEDELLQSLWRTLECLIDHHLAADMTAKPCLQSAPKTDQSMVLLFNKNNKEEVQ